MITVKDVINRREPNFDNLLKVLKREKPDRYTLFEFFLNKNVFKEVTGREYDHGDKNDVFKNMIETYYMLGYDYVTMHASVFDFDKDRSTRGTAASISLNDDIMIADMESFKAYTWKNPADCYDRLLENLEPFLPSGMKFIVYGPGGVLENVIRLTGYDNLCLMLFDDPALVEAIFEKVGSALAEYYKLIINYDSVGAIISNDDWGFNTQTMLPPEDMRKYVFPWHKRITDIAHNANKPVILHSCGNLTAVFDDIINYMKYDGKHSYEDVINPVENAYDELHEKIAVIGGIDLDYISRMSHEKIIERCSKMLDKTNGKAYALGTGNSIPEYTPNNNYYAMIYSALHG